MEPERFAKDVMRIHKILPYIEVLRRDVRYTVSSPGSWVAHTDVGLSRIDVDGRLTIAKDGILLDGRETELCLSNRRTPDRCLSASGVKVRIGALILAFYSWIDALPVQHISRRKMLYYVNNVEKNPELAEFAIWALASRNALFEDAIDVAIAATEEIRRVRLAAYVPRRMSRT
jgi:hypothetical protein